MHRKLLAPWAAILSYFVIGIFGHGAMIDPAPIDHPSNPFAVNANYDYNNPLSPSGSDFPCKGKHLLLNSPEGQSVAAWNAGQNYKITLSVGAFHLGGSCQASLSFDGGKTFKVIHSWIGNCPSANGETSYDFAVPRDTPSAEKAIFSWTWFNKIGNREMYMNCAVVKISGANGGNLDNRPDMFMANVGNGCSTVETQDLAFPSPGDDVTVQSSNTAPPSGNCASGPGLTGPGSPENQGEHRPGESSPPGGTPTETPAPPVGKPRIGPPPAEGQPPFEPAPPVEGQPSTPEPPKQSGLPDQVECRCSSPVANYIPGNDWPDWFNSADRLRPRVFYVASVQLVLFMALPFLARFLAI